MYLLYNILLLFALPLVVVYHLYRSASRGRPAAMKQRFGFLPDLSPLNDSGLRPIWVHAVSVGESMASRPLLKAIKARFPERRLILSNMTETGRAVASRFPEVDLCIYFPFDLRCAVRRLLKGVNPAAVVIVETELWPNFIREAWLAGIPVIIANGRISDRSFDGYTRAKRFFRPVLAHVAGFCMQSEEDARRIIAIGAPQGAVTVGRNLKFDIPAAPVPLERKAELCNRFGIPSGRLVITAGSTHPGEEELVVEACRTLSLVPFLVLVPRHPERAPEVAAMLAGKGVRYTLRSALPVVGSAPVNGDLLLVDTVGELMQFYALADIVFVGGSLVPTGGHNLLEPASLGKPVLFGPHMNNFREIAALVEQYGAGTGVGPEGLEQALAGLIGDPGAREAMGKNGIRLVSDNGGATDRHMAVIERFVRGAV